MIAFSDFVFFLKQQQRSNRRGWEADSDEASETSSICSDRSFSSSIGGARITEDINEAITLLSSAQWSERKDGLQTLKNMLQTGRTFSRAEIKRLCELFARLFHDQHVKVLAVLLDTLNDFVRRYKSELREWLYTLLTRLLAKLGAESLNSIQHKLCMCLETTRESFDLDAQFAVLVQFIKENSTQFANLKIKLAVLNYLQDIICLMEPVDMQNMSGGGGASDNDLKAAIGKIVALTGEPKSLEIRKTSQAVLVAMFNLNAHQFTAMLADLPKNVQDTASKVLKMHIKSLNNVSTVVDTSINNKGDF